MSQQNTTVRNIVVGIVVGVGIIAAVASVIVLLLNEQLQFNKRQEESAEARLERIKPISQVKVKGIVRKALPSNLVFNSGKEVYEAVCTTCHTAGVVGAPKFADKSHWAERLAKGEEALITSAINGLNVMPPRGGNSGLSDEAVKLAVQYMLAAANDGKTPITTPEPTKPSPPVVVGKSGKEIYDTVCMACHMIGILNAPKYGDKESWAIRLAKGEATLVSNAINGFNNIMPARGGNSDLSDEEVKRSVQYMLAAVSDEEAPAATSETAEAEIPVVAGKSSKEIYETACMTCHTTGALNAPKYGDKESWAKSLAKDEATLVSNAINSFNEVVPALDGHSDLSDDEVKRAVQYMLAAVSDEEAPAATSETAEAEIAPAEKKKTSQTPIVVGKSGEKKKTSQTPIVVGKSGKEIYDTVCMTCHTTAVLNAPKYGDKESWAKSLAKDEATLVSNAINSFNEVVPALDGHSDLSDDEVKRAVQYMLAAVSDEDVPVASPPVSEVAPTEPEEQAETVPAVAPKEDTPNIITPINEPKKVDEAPIDESEKTETAPVDESEKTETAPVDDSETVTPASAPENTETAPVDESETVTPADESEKVEAAPVDESETVTPASAPEKTETAPVDDSETVTPADESEKTETAPVDVPEKETQYHTVQSGETLYAISRHYEQDYRDIATWNNIIPPYALTVGQRLVVSPPKASTAPSEAEEKRFFHIIQNGDTLFRISRSYGVSTSDLKTWNGLQVPYILSIGQKLWVSPPATIVPPQIF